MHAWMYPRMYDVTPADHAARTPGSQGRRVDTKLGTLEARRNFEKVCIVTLSKNVNNPVDFLVLTQ